MISGLKCEHCARENNCMEAWREMVCRSFKADRKKIFEDPAIKRQARAAAKRERKRIRKEIEELNK